MTEKPTEKTTDRTNLNSLPRMQTVGEALGPNFLERALMPTLPTAPSMSPETAAAIRAGIKELIRETVREVLREELAQQEAMKNG